MLWLNPSALFALAAVTAPILIHILIQRRAERFPFPTLRFLQPTRLAAIRRHLLEDLPLLAIRISLVAAAVAALAGPLLLTSARRQLWDRRTVRAIVTETGGSRAVGPEQAPASAEATARQETFAAATLADGIRRAILWLDTAPPARREIVIASAFPIGSITDADVAAVPAGIGLRFERAGSLPSTRAVAIGRLLTPDGVRRREVTLTGVQTASRDVAAGEPVLWPIDVVSSEAGRPAIDAAIAAVLWQHVWAAPPDRRARVVLVPGPGAESGVVQAFPPPLAGIPGELRRDAPKREQHEGGGPAVINGLSDAAPITQPWMADAIARIARDPDLRAAGVRVADGLADARFAAAPWQPLASAADGRPLAVAAGSARGVVVASAAPASDVATPVLLRSIADAIADVPDLQRAEVVPIADAALQRWSRPPLPVTAPAIETIDQDDRRWLWAVVLCLLAFESWVRRARSAQASRERETEQARVA
jgi:hypothetical protein